MFKGTKKFKKLRNVAFLLYKKSEEELFKNYKKSLREDIRRAIKKGLVFTELDKEKFDEFYSLYKSLMRNKFKREPINYQFLKNIFFRLNSKNFATLYGVYKNKNLLSSVMILKIDSSTSLAFLQGTSELGYSLNAPSFLFHNTIIEEFRKGSEIFSFGAGKNKGLLHFKKSFGTEEYEYYIYIWFNPWYIEEL